MRSLIISILVFSIGITSNLMAQENTETTSPWVRTMVGTLNLTQNSFDNWTQGGEDSWAWLVDINGTMTRTTSGGSWASNGKLAYGESKIGDEDARKAADELRLETVYNWNLGMLVNPYVAATARTQLTEGYQYSDEGIDTVSNFLDPGYFTQSFGLGYSPNEHLKTRLGAAVKETIASDFDYLYTDDPETDDEIEDNKVEYGAESVTNITMPLNDIILFTSKLEMFSDLNRIDEVDVNWDNLFSAQIAKFLAVNLNVQLYYDKDISIKRQLKQTLSVGLTYTFI